MNNRTINLAQLTLICAGFGAAILAVGLLYSGSNSNLMSLLCFSVVLVCICVVPLLSVMLRQNEALAESQQKLEEAQGLIHKLSIITERNNSTDKTTGLLDRNSFAEAVIRNRKMGACGVLVLISMKEFKQINDRYGFAAGDDALSKVSFAIKNAVRGSDPIGRSGDKEFCVYLDNVTAQTVSIALNRIAGNINAIQFNPGGQGLFHISADIGYTLDVPGTNFEVLMQRANGALSNAQAQMQSPAQSQIQSPIQS